MRTYLKPLLVIGLVVLLAVLISWFAFPGWRAQPGGLALVVGAAVVGVAAVAKDAIDIAKGWRELNKAASTTKASSRKLTQSQVMEKSADGEQTMKRSGGDQKQTMQESPRGKQHME
jgi:hypothetical protein